MNKKVCLFILLIFFSNSVFAEYYLVYTPPQCTDCVDAFPPPLDYQTYHHKAHKVYKNKKIHHKVSRHKTSNNAAYKPKYKPKAVKVYTQSNACGECENCICGDGYAISTSQPEYPGEHCTSYEDELRGRQALSGY